MLDKLRKLRKMSADEVRCRLTSLVRMQRERRLYRGDLRASPIRALTDVVPSELCGAAQAIVPGTRGAEVERLTTRFPDSRRVMAQASRGRCEQILSGRWEMLGHSFDLRSTVDWHRDPRSKKRWPKCFSADVALHQGASGGVDVKYVWELGRQQYVAELARGWLLAGQEQYARLARRLILDWIRSNPLYEGVHWTSALEVAIRAISWIWSIASLGQWTGWKSDDLEQIAASLADHATYLEHHFSYYSSPYNHLIGEASGLHLIGIVLSGHSQADRWRQLGRQVLKEYGPRQFFKDGFCVEQATGYHFYTLGFLMQAICVARRENNPLKRLEPVVHRALCAGAAFRQPDGRWPAIGDVDSARSIPVQPDDFWDFGSLCALGSVMFNDAMLKAASSTPGEETYWLLGTDGLARWQELDHQSLPGAVFLEDSGYAIARTPSDWLLFDAGPIADGLHADATPSTAHGHADALQVLYCHGKRPILIDSGIPYYFGSTEWVKYFRGSASHNTLEVEGVALARHVGQLAWSHVIARPCLDAKLSDGAWMARGHVDWEEKVIAERHLLALPGTGLWIADWVGTDRPRTVRWNWRFTSDGLLAVNGEQGAFVEAGQPVQLDAWCENGPLVLNVHTANDDSPVGWVATGYGKLESGLHVRGEIVVDGAALVVTSVATESLPVHVWLKGHEVGSSPFETRNPPEVAGLAGCQAGSGSDEIIWRIGNQAEQRIFRAGNDTLGPAGDWTPLVGAGDWPAEYYTKTLD